MRTKYSKVRELKRKERFLIFYSRICKLKTNKSRITLENPLI